jgi:PBSX family phage terminase large subunit
VIDLAGFDDDQRIEKILGRGFNRIYLNECSQLSYEVVSICKTRLSRKAGGLKQKLIYDCNPPSKLHWVYSLFVEKRDPTTGNPLPDPGEYASLRINPSDNLDNLPDDFMATLNTLPDLKRQRFRDGEWTVLEGAIYSNFSEANVLRRNGDGSYGLPPMEKYSVGLDFGLNMAAVLVGWAGDNVYLIDDAGSYNSTTSTFNQEIWDSWSPIVGEEGYIAYCDPAGGERIQEVYNGYKANNSVEPGIDYIRTKIENGQFFVCDRCVGFLSEVYSYHYDSHGKPVKENDHAMDALRYGVFSEATYNNFSIE